METRRTGDPATWCRRSTASSASRALLVSQSAIGYYGDRGDEVVDESTRPAASGFDSEVVQEWENAARSVEAALCGW